MFKPDPRSAKLLTAFQGDAKVSPRSLSASKALYDKAPGLVKIRWNRLTGGAQSVRGILTETEEGSGQEIAEQFLADNRELFAIPIEDAGLRCVGAKEHRGVQHVKYQQFANGLPVIGAEVTVHIDRANRVQMVNGSYYPEIDVETTAPSILEEAAVEAVLNILDVEDHSVPQVEFVIFPRGESYIRAYRVTLHTKKPLGDWVFFIDASTGDVIDHYNAINFVRGKGYLYNTNPRRDATLVTADLFELDDSKTLSGTYFKIKNAVEGGERAPTTGPQEYDFLYADPADTHFDEVMVYYHLSKVAKFFRNLGFAEHNEQMLAHVHVPNPYNGNPNYDNAYFSPFEHAIYFGDGDELNDLAQEAAVIYHEYSHSVVDAIQPLMATPEAGALHEGYADYFACSLTNDPKIGEFAVGELGGEFLRDLRNQRTYETITRTDVHEDGEIWGTTCWKIREVLGRRVTDLLLYGGLWYLPANASFADAYEGILQADADLFGAVHTRQLNGIFDEQKITTEPSVMHTIVASANAGGVISPSGAISVEDGLAQMFTIEAKAGFYVKHVLVDGDSIGALTGYTFENITASHTIEAFFDNETVTTQIYAITANAGPGGIISPSGAVAVNRGTHQTFTMTADMGHTIQQIFVDEVSIGAVNEYTFENVSSVHTIEAVFEESEQQDEVTVIVPGDVKWIYTGIDLNAGDIIRFTARGTIVYDDQGNSCGPDGASWTDTLDQEGPLWKKPHAGLIGRIDGIGAPFFVGKSYTVKAGSSGRLLLGINDFWYHGNSGEFTVTIRLLQGIS